MSDSDAILFDTRGALGVITLNRPKALNALTRAMCLALHARLDAWAGDDGIDAVLIEGAGDKALCAGGDVVMLHDSGKAGGEDWRWFFHDEYRMNSAIHHFPKPYIALQDGITMGGGVGVSVHGDFRVATERVLFAMPETGLGLIPDVGGGYFLPRLPGQTGLYLALTGYRARAADCLYLGVATHHVPSAALADLTAALAGQRLADAAAVAALIDRFGEDPGPAPLAEHRDAIDRHFAHDSVAAIMASLADDGSEWARKTHALLTTKSPISMKVTFEQLRRGATLAFDENMVMEYRIVNRILTHDHDFYEGVRAILLDKDNKPVWNPARLEDVAPSDVAAHFEPPAAGDLTFD